MRKVILFSCLCLISLLDFVAARTKYITSLPFELIGSYVVFTVRINDSSPLRLILDSGIRNTIITELSEGDYINLNYSDVRDLIGLGTNSDTLKAYSSNYNVLKIGKLQLKNRNVLVLKEDLFNLSRHTGAKINGLIGMDLFQNHVIDINYSKQKMYIYDPESFVPPAHYDSLHMSTEGFKMYIDLVALSTNDTTKRKVKMLLDTGAELNAWFQTYRKGAVPVPAKSLSGTIGEGLNGEIFGSFGRLESLSFGTYTLKHPIVAFPDSVCIADVIGKSDRDGTVGSQLLKRFNYIVDYPNRKFYFTPGSMFNLPFNYNIAGIEVIQLVPGLSQTEVWKVWRNSPAEKAGVLPGDQIVEVDGRKAFELSIGELKSYFTNPVRHKLEIKIVRGSETRNLLLDLRATL